MYYSNNNPSEKDDEKSYRKIIITKLYQIKCKIKINASNTIALKHA